MTSIPSTYLRDGSTLLSGWILKRIDKEVMKHNDFIRITDIKDKHGSIAISYESLNNVDYDDFIEQLIQLGN